LNLFLANKEARKTNKMISSIKQTLFGIIACGFVGNVMSSVPSEGNHYYVDANSGKDSNPGTSPKAAWKSLDVVNGHTFRPGESIYFKTGCKWEGQLHPKGSGTPDQPIIIDQYGTGSQPVIDALGATGNGAVYLKNQEYWEICNLNITNDAAQKGDRRGIYLMASSGSKSVFRHLVVRNCTIHHIKGIASATGNAAKRTAGILLEIINEGSSRARFDDVCIEDCEISTIDNIGIALNSVISEPPKAPIVADKKNVNSEFVEAGDQETKDYPGTPDWESRKFTHVVIRKNRVHDIAKNAMIIRFTDETGLIEHNVCWDTAGRGKSGNTIFSRSCRGTIFQYNEGYLNHAIDHDGSLYDADLASPGCIFQYSYSHDNNEGLFWQCTDWRDDHVIVRYNISQNDKGKIFCMNYPCSGCSVYNNTVYIGPDCSPTIISERRIKTKTRRYSFSNNIIYNLSHSARYEWFNAARTFDSNLFFGQHPADEPKDRHQLTCDPLLENPGSGRLGLGTLNGYLLKKDSPCINSGVIIAENGGMDLWRHIVPQDLPPDRGANQYSK